MTAVKTVFVVLPTYVISVALTIEIHKNNINTSNVTNKQHYKIVFVYMFLPNKTDIFRDLLPYTTYFFQGNTSFQAIIFSLSDVKFFLNLY